MARGLVATLLVASLALCPRAATAERVRREHLVAERRGGAASTGGGLMTCNRLAFWRGVRGAAFLLVALLLAGLLAGCDRLPFGGEPKIARVGYLAPGSPEWLSENYAASFVQGLRDQGYISDENIEIEWALLSDHPGAQFSDLAAMLVDDHVQVIVTSTTPAVLAAAHATRTIPIVSAGPSRSLTDLGLVEQDSRPGGNVTGTGENAEVYGKLVELLAEAVPNVSRVAYLRNPTTQGSAEQMARSKATADALGLSFLELQARTPEEIDAAVAAALQAHVDGLIISADNLFSDSNWHVVRLANASRLPTIYSQVPGYLAAGGMLAYSADFVASQRRAAAYTAKILRGANPAELPVERAMSFNLGVNLKTAEGLGLTVPQTILLQSTQVIR